MGRPPIIHFYGPQRNAVVHHAAALGLVTANLRAVECREQVLGNEDAVYVQIHGHPLRPDPSITDAMRAMGWTFITIDDSYNRRRR